MDRQSGYISFQDEDEGYHTLDSSYCPTIIERAKDIYCLIFEPGLSNIAGVRFENEGIETFIRLFAGCVHPGYLLYKSRAKHQLASKGVFLDATQLRCFCCDKVSNNVSTFETVESQEWHHSNCIYHLERSKVVDSTAAHDVIDSDAWKPSRLLTHIRDEMSKSKVVVAMEFGFHRDIICMVIARHYLRMHRPYKDAGSLVYDLQEEEIQKTWTFTLTGIADYIQNIQDIQASNHDPSLTLTTPSCSYPQSRDENIGKSKEAPQRENSLTQSSIAVNDRSEELRKETLKLLYDTLCKSCLKRKVEVLLFPCEHLSLCNSCLANQKVCPLCTTEIKSSIKVYVDGID